MQYSQLPNFIYDLALQATQNAAIACYAEIGRGDKNVADNLAVKAMRETLGKSLEIYGTVVIGEGEMDEAPMLFIGETLGHGRFECDIAVDPLEGTSLCANNMPNSITTIAISQHKSILAAPDMYMDKIASCKVKKSGIIGLDITIKTNIANLAQHLNKPVEEITVCVLDRPRHAETIRQIRAMGCRVNLISDGDIAGILQTYYSDSIDLYVGSGGAPEGVLAAAAIKSLGGFMQGKLLFENDEQKYYARQLGIEEFDKIYNVEDMIRGDVVFAATGVTGGFLDGVKKHNQKHFTTTSIVMQSGTKTINKIISEHFLD
ncbi:MAG: fructose 1,6-bisphosphatase [Pseudomonadota bacterium]|jgi:fructose-1,6-bisphosphatase II / sedoheptulose-1,7-bisphosphatase